MRMEELDFDVIDWHDDTPDVNTNNIEKNLEKTDDVTKVIAKPEEIEKALAEPSSIAELAATFEDDIKDTVVMSPAEISAALEEADDDLTEEEIAALGDLSYQNEELPGNGAIETMPVLGVSGVEDQKKKKSVPQDAKSKKSAPVKSKPVSVQAKKRSNSAVNAKKESRKESKSGFQFSVLDLAIAFVGAIVVLMLLFIVIIWREEKETMKDVGEFVTVGGQLSSLETIGENGINRVVSMASEGIEGEAVVTTPEGEEILLSVTFTSIEKDLKIKFTNKYTEKLLTGTMFAIEAIAPNNDVLEWKDEDCDGVIHLENLAPGNYMVTIRPVDGYTFPEEATKVIVKDRIVYTAINILDEVKTEAEINPAKEDGKVQKVVDEEPKLDDTIEWVASTKTIVAGEDGYATADKTKIPDPETLIAASTVGAGAFRQLGTGRESGLVALADKGTQNITLKVGQETQLVPAVETSSEYTFAYAWAVSGDAIQTMSGSDTPTMAIKAIKAGEVTVTCTVTKTRIEPPTEQPPSSEPPTEQPPSSEPPTEQPPSSEPPASSAAPSPNPANTEQDVYRFRIKVEEENPNAGKVTGFVLSAESLTLTVDEERELTATVSGDETTNKAVDVVVADTNIAEYKDGKVKAKAAGTTTITFTTAGTMADGNKITKKCTVTVVPGKLTLTVAEKQKTLRVGETYQISAVLKNDIENKGVTFTSADSTIASVDANGLVTAVAKGGPVKIVISTNAVDHNKSQVVETVEITVLANPKTDKTTPLQDAEGQQVYVKEADGKYRAAVWADYYTAEEFFVKSDVQYKYTGWQTISGKTYFFDKDGKKVVGQQVILGVKYNFGANGALSMNGGVLGIDVSKYQTKIDWKAVKESGISFVIIRCGYRGYSTGVLVQDPMFETHIKGATEAGLKVGIYFFSQAINEKEAVEEASMAVALAKKYSVTYPIYIDTEQVSGGRANNLDTATRTSVCKAFCETVKAAGYTPGIYASKSWYETKLDTASLGGYKIWLAQYASTPTYKGKYDMWQYTEKGKVNGVTGNVDMNISYLGY